MNKKKRSPFGDFIEPLLKRRGWNANKISKLNSETGKHYSRSFIGLVMLGERTPSQDLLSLLYKKACLTVEEREYGNKLISISTSYTLPLNEINLSCEQKILLISTLDALKTNDKALVDIELKKLGEILI